MTETESNGSKTEGTANKPDQSNNSSLDDNKLKQILSEQSSQMLSLIAISNAQGKENDKLRSENKNLTEQLIKAQNEKNNLQSIFNMQTVLFVLLILILVWVYNLH